jgi:nucleoside-diphosphate-sugar epimerase
MQDKKILILGGTGHLGSTLTHHLIQDLHIPAAHIRIFYLAGSPVDALADIEGLDFSPGNVLNETDVRRACEGVQVVFHLNVEGTRHVLDAVKDSPSFEKLCYVSTVNVLALNSLGVLPEK